MPSKKDPPSKNTAGKGKRSGKAAPKTARKKKRSGKTAAPTKQADDQAEERGAEKRVALMRDKLKKSLEDPEMRDQIVRAIRTMLNEGRS